MLELVGDILNWVAAGVLFPLMILPLMLAFLTNMPRHVEIIVWIQFWMFAAGLGFIFVQVTPSIDATGIENSDLFVPMIILSSIIVWLLGGPRSATRRISPIFQRITTLAGRAVMWLLLVMALVQFAVVLLRYVFGVNWILMQESITYMHGFVFLIAAGYALLVDEHVRVDIFYREAPPKRKALVDLLGTYFLLFPICLLIMWTASPYVGRSWLVMEGSADTSGIQGVFILKSLIPLFAVLLSMAGFVIATRAVSVLREED